MAVIGIEPEIVQRAEANGVRIRILGKGLGVPSHALGIWFGIQGSLLNPVLPTVPSLGIRMIRRGMKSDVTDVDSGPERDAEGLNRAIEILVVNGVFVMPHAGGWVRYFINDERTTIDSRLRLD